MALSALGGCDLFDVDGTGSVAIREPSGPFAGGTTMIVADYALDEEVDSWTVRYGVDDGRTWTPQFSVDEATGEQLLEMQVDVFELAAGPHKIAIELYVDGQTVRDELTFEVVDGVVLKSVELANVGWDGDFGGDPEPEIHLFDATDGAWLGCAAAYGGLAIRGGGGAPLLRSDLEGRSVYVAAYENDSEYGCEPPVGDNLLGQGHDFLGQSDAFLLDGDVATEAGAGEKVTVGFGVGR